MNLTFFRCKKCGQIVAKVEATGADIYCCGEPMVEMVPNTVDASVEKHVPIYVEMGNDVMVKVGSDDHPMIKEHFVKWIYVETDTGAYFKCLHPGDEPEANFKFEDDETLSYVLELCNLHGLWRG